MLHAHSLTNCSLLWLVSCPRCVDLLLRSTTVLKHLPCDSPDGLWLKVMGLEREAVPAIWAPIYSSAECRLSLWAALAPPGPPLMEPAVAKAVQFLWGVQIFTMWKRIKLMKLQTQKINREMNFTTKVRSICTDKSMKNSRVHHWNCSVCTDEQVNCPFCLLWERCLKPIFPRRISQPYALGKKKSAMENSKTD